VTEEPLSGHAVRHQCANCAGSSPDRARNLLSHPFAPLDDVLVVARKELVAAIAGLALFTTIGNGLAAALRDENQREPALVTFLVTASGVTLSGVGSAFWGLVAGVVTLLILRAGSRRG